MILARRNSGEDHPGRDLSPWLAPEYNTEQRLTQLIDTDARVTPYPAETTRRMWADHTFNALPLRPA